MPLDVEYSDLIASHPKVAAVLPPQVLKYMKSADKKTYEYMNEAWENNITENVKTHLPKYGWLNEGFVGFGNNKAAIAIGSGPSLKKNEDVLRMVSLVDGIKPVENQEFILMASNHQIKPCLEAGIIPHFAMIVDSSENLIPQMDVGENGKHTVLIAAVTAHPEAIKAWPGPVKFVSQQSAVVRGFLDKATGTTMPVKNCVIEGGNIMNLSFALSIGLFRTPVWMCVGNDLSFTSEGSIEERRESYYADGDYETNKKSKRDEAAHHFAWAGIEFNTNDKFFSSMDYVNLKVLYTSPQLFIYKSWLESNALLLWDEKFKFKIYNCTEGGILGVNIKEGVEGYEEKFDANNWCLLDQLSGSKWRTRRLADAVEEFHRAREILKEQSIWTPGTPMVVPENRIIQ